MLTTFFSTVLTLFLISLLTPLVLMFLVFFVDRSAFYKILKSYLDD